MLLKKNQYKPEDIQELFRKLLDDLQNIHEELAEFINSPGWNRPAVYDDDDDDVDYTIAITPVLSTKEPDNSLSMEDERLDIIPAMESDEVIKSSVEDLVPIPSESEGIPDIMCDVHLVNNPTPIEAKDHFEIVINSNDDYSSSDNDSLYYEKIEYVETSPHDSEFVSLEVEKIVIPEDEEIEDDNLREKLLKVNLIISEIEALKDNPTPSFELLTNGSTTTQSDISLPEYDSFIFDLSNDQFPPTDRSDFTHEEFGDELAHIISSPEYECFYFGNLPDPGELISSPNSGIRENLSSTTCVNLPVEDDYSPLLAYVIEEEQAASARYWKIPACCDDDDDYDSAITPILSTEETDNSLSMGDEHLDTIPAMESDEVIKSSVENLVPIPSEFEGISDTMCNVHLVNKPTPLEAKDHFEIVTKSNDDISSSDDDSLYNENIEYVEASPHDSEVVGLEAEIVIPDVGGIDDDILLTIKDDNLREKLLNVHLLIANIEALKDDPTQSSEFLTKSSSTSPKSFLEETNTFHNSLHEYENFYFDLEEISSGSTTIHSDISLPDYEAFYFNDDHIEEISSGSTTTHSDISLFEYDSFTFYLVNDQFPPTNRSDFANKEYVVPTCGVIVPTGRDVVPTGRVIVATGREVSPGKIQIVGPGYDYC
nr:hypothetical protein [Tanacetum cinerariifolium]